MTVITYVTPTSFPIPAAIRAASAAAAADYQGLVLVILGMTVAAAFFLAAGRKRWLLKE